MSEIIKKAREEISRLCNRGNWQMCIPPDQINDSDFIFSKLCDHASNLQSQLTEKEALLEEAVGLLLAIQQEYQFLTIKEFLAKLKAGENNE